MNLKTVLAEVQSWPVEDRIRLIEEVWDGLSSEGRETELTEDLKDLLDGRLAALDSDPGNVVTWERCPTANCSVYRASRSGSIWIVQALSTGLLNEHSPDTNGTQVVFERDDPTGPTGTNVVEVPRSTALE